MTLLSKLLLAAALTLPIAGFAGPAAASEDNESPAWTHPIRWDDSFNDRALPQNVVRAKLEATYGNVHDVDRAGDFYLARAEDGNGRAVTLTADAYTGRINDVVAMSDDNRYRTYYNGRASGSGHRNGWHDSQSGF